MFSPFCFFSVMNSSFLAAMEEACFNYPMVTEWQNQSQLKWLPNEITAQSSLSLFSAVVLKPRLHLEQPILAQNIHFILQPSGPSWCQRDTSHSPRLSLFHSHVKAGHVVEEEEEEEEAPVGALSHWTLHTRLTPELEVSDGLKQTHTHTELRHQHGSQVLTHVTADKPHRH